MERKKLDWQMELKTTQNSQMQELIYPTNSAFFSNILINYLVSINLFSINLLSLNGKGISLNLIHNIDVSSMSTFFFQ